MRKRKIINMSKERGRSDKTALLLGWLNTAMAEPAELHILVNLRATALVELTIASLSDPLVYELSSSTSCWPQIFKVHIGGGL